MCRLAKAASLKGPDRLSLAEPASESLMPAGEPPSYCLSTQPFERRAGASLEYIALGSVELRVIALLREERTRVRMYEEIPVSCVLSSLHSCSQCILFLPYFESS